MSKPKLHFLHIGKAGGTSIKHALKEHLEDGYYSIILHRHETRLIDVPEGEKVFFFLRNPLTRFVSGFYSRMRQGKPRYNSPWSKEEAKAFSFFKTANELAEAITDTDAIRRQEAQSAMCSIQHVRDSFWLWFRDAEYLASRINDIFFIGFQETMDADFVLLKAALGLGNEVQLPTDPLEKHSNPESIDASLSDLAKMNLLTHYSKDMEFYNMLIRAAFQTLTAEQSVTHNKNEYRFLSA